ncbi:MAG: helix-turn-helix domain-containing protein [Polyangiaceae bacterium]|nr:helix-turn-helix domain-containing protein [Polyangiaceae bacterium]
MAKRVLGVASALGADEAQLLTKSGLDRGLLTDPKGRVPIARVLDFLALLLEKASVERLGIILATTSEPDAYHTPALILLASETLARGFARAFEYQRLWGDGDRFAIVSGADVGRPRSEMAVSFRAPGRRHAATGVLEVCALAETLMAVRFLTGEADAAPVAWALPFAPADVDSLVAFFKQPPARVSSPAYVAFERDTMNRPVATAHALFRGVFEQQARSEIDALPALSELRGRVRAFLARALTTGSFSLQRCAVELALSPRTLERRLAEEGTSYAAELDEARRAAAQSLLTEGRTVDEVAFLTGYSERAAFHRACVRWFDRTPGQMRRRAIHDGA